MKKKSATQKPELQEGIRLNKYIANAGICARRKADEFIEQGFVTVNGEVIRAMGFRVKKEDVVKFKGKTIAAGKKYYVLLNKPKNYITTTSDERERHTVMELIEGACSERLYPVGRLDRNTTGLLLFTNDGELAQKLTHPGNKIKKVYRVSLNKPLTKEDMKTIASGLQLEDGLAMIDAIAYADNDKRIIGIELHIGKNRIVRRIFEHLDYTVEKLDRVLYAGLTKKDLPRGRWRHLTEKEVVQLKHFM